MPKKSTAPSPKTKPDKPYPDFPLFAHDGGVWAKKVRGKLHYFGPWADPQAALDKWLDQRDDLMAGRKPRPRNPDALTVGDLCNLFIESRDRRVATGEIAARTILDYTDTAKEVIACVGRSTAVEHLEPSDFAKLRAAMAKGRNLKTLEGHIARSRAIFNHAEKNGLIDKPLARLWGTEFAKPSTTALNKLSNQTERLFTAYETRRLIDGSEGQLRAMVHLGINAALGPTDIGLIRFGDIDRDGWLTLPRSKTGKPRRIPLWAETLAAIEGAKRVRPEPHDPNNADLLFVTKYGQSWTPTRTRYPLTAEFNKLRNRLGIEARGKAFYALRHTLQTIGDETRDFVAVAAIMGHSPSSISDRYRERIGDDRLQAVTDCVHDWVWPRPLVLTTGGDR